MSQRAPSLPQISTEPRPLAGRDQRFAAALVDGILWSIVVLVGHRLLRSLLVPAAPMWYRAEQELVMVASSLPLLVYQWRLIARTGQSIGKRWLRIEIVRIEGAPQPGWLHGVVLREWVLHGLFIGWYIVSGPKNQAANLLSLAFFLPIFGSQRRCAHDYIAGTQVVRVASDGKPHR